MSQVVRDPEPVWTGIEAVRLAAGRAAGSDSTVLITGETGVGKDVVARWIHQNSRRRRGPFLAVDIASRSNDLIASELFGHEQGAFTGATRSRPGCFRASKGGTVFLDEIGDLPLEHQQRLLRVLQNKEVQPVGSDKAEPVDARVIAATNVDLPGKVKEGTFRQDLYYRLNVLRLHVPPLRERRQAIPELADRLLTGTLQQQGLMGKSLAADAITWLQERPWPGNVRELDNLLERAAILLDGVNIAAQDLALLYSEDERAGHTQQEQERRVQDALIPIIDTMAPAATLESRRDAVRIASWLHARLVELEVAGQGEAAGATLLQGFAVDTSNPLLGDLALAFAVVIVWDLRRSNEGDPKARRLVERWGESLGKARSHLGPLRTRIRQYLSLIGLGASIPGRPIY